MAISSNQTVLLLGCGYTARRVALRFLKNGAQVIATTRQPESLTDLAAAGVQIVPLDWQNPATLQELSRVVPAGVLVLHSVPLVQTGPQPDELADPTPELLTALGDRPARLVYLSTTSVYGAAHRVDETTPVAPRVPRESLRVAAEEAVLGGPWSGLVLRPAAIYGPGRGAQVSIREGRYRMVGAGNNFISRIHVDDLAAHCEAALLRADITGAYPVADEEPATVRQMAEFCANLLNLPIPGSRSPQEVARSLQADRLVDGRAVRHLLDITLQYPSYRVGIPASLAAEV